MALIYGEKSVIMGKPPKIIIGAATARSDYRACGVLILIYVRQAAKAMDPGGPLGPALPEAPGRSFVAQ